MKPDSISRVSLVTCCLLPGVVLAQASPFMTGATALQTNILILRCSAGEGGGTSAFASRLIGDQQVVRRQRSRGREGSGWGRASRSVTEQYVTEPAVLPAEIEQLPDLKGYFKPASSPAWFTVRLGVPHDPDIRL